MQSTDQPGKISIPFARDGTKRTIPNDSQIGIVEGAASFETGFPPKTFLPVSAGGIPPAGSDFNGILNQVTAIQKWQSAGGMFGYDSDFSAAIGGYPKNAQLLKSDGTGVWQSTVENNASNPDSGGAGWITGAASAMYLPPGSSGIPTTVQNELRRQIWLDNYPSLHAAIAELAMTGGVINLSLKAYPPEVWKYDTAYMSTPNITLRGVKMPKPSYNCDRLEGGSIIQGRFNVFANNFCVENIGFDQGKYVVDTYYGGLDTHTANHPNGDTWDSFAFAQPNQVTPLALRTGFYARNVIALARDSLSVGHALLMEGYMGAYIDNVVGIGAIHGAVIKGISVYVGKIAGYSASGEHVIVKSDSFAPCNTVYINAVETDAIYPGCAPWFTPSPCQYGLLFNPSTADMSSIRVGSAVLRGAQNLLIASGTLSDGVPIRTLDNFKIESCEIEGFGFVGARGVTLESCIFYRCALDTVTVNNVNTGLTYRQYVMAGSFAASALSVGTLRLGGTISEDGLRGIDYARVVINNLICESTTATLYNFDDTARINVGRESITGTVSTKFGNNPPVLNSSWAQSVGNMPFRVILDGYGAMATGLLTPVAGGSAQIFSLPPYLRTSFPARFGTMAQGTGGIWKSLVVNIDPGQSSLQINDGLTAVGAEQLLSLDGLSWSFD